MTAFTIREVPDDIARRIKVRAAEAGQCLQSYLLSLVTPHLLNTEIASALLGMARGSTIAPASLDEHFKTYRGLRVQRHETGPLLPGSESGTPTSPPTTPAPT
ncbi:hypothetical protein [Streptomyces erythrochromogenes]|uniref:hypothetical protein n=1 Tax=Streptomyces erythrochromogenes TaxID=285574 RepID=UPI00386D6D43|nr:hypothetical protein OG364_24605 [Streptomyces erythrochromogenes]